MEVERLKKIPLFEAVPEGDLKVIATFAELTEVPTGKVLVEEGDFSNDLMAIEEGTAEVTRDGEHVAVLGPGDVFGEMGLLEKQHRNATVTATSPIKLIVLTRWELMRMRRKMPDVVERIERLIEERKSN